MGRTTMRTASTKPCQNCGQDISFQRKWSRCWSRISFCSERCRRGVVRDDDLEFEDAIFQLLRTAGRGESIGPVDVIRLLKLPAGEKSVNRILAAAYRMCTRGLIDVVERGGHVARDEATDAARFELRTMTW